MKYSEFNNKYPDLELQYTDVMLFIYCDGVMIGKVSKKFRYKMSTMYDGFEQLAVGYGANLLMNMTMLAETPLAEREEEKRYRLRIVANLGFMDDQRFLNLNIEREEYFICSARQSEWVKTIFTESEIAEMDITGFEKVEVVG